MFLVEKTQDEMFITMRSLDAIQDAMRQTQERTGLPVKIIIIDPISNHWGREKTENSNEEVRLVLMGLRKIAEETGVMFLLIQHVGKAERDTMAQRVIGSTAITAMCRSVWGIFAVKQEDGKIKRYLLPENNNLLESDDGIGIIYEITNAKVEIHDTEFSKTATEFAKEQSPASPQGGDSGRPKKESLEAEKWLREFLSDGRKPVGSEGNPITGTICYECEQAGHSMKTVRMAGKTLNITHKKECGVTFWYLPNTTGQLAHNSISENQLAHNSFSENGGTALQTDECIGQTGQLAQNCLCTGNLGKVGQVAHTRPEPLGDILDHDGNKTNDNGRHKMKRLAKPALPENKTESQDAKTFFAD